jgi:hypothetical protein
VGLTSYIVTKCHALLSRYKWHQVMAHISSALRPQTCLTDASEKYPTMLAKAKLCQRLQSDAVTESENLNSSKEMGALASEKN